MRATRCAAGLRAPILRPARSSGPSARNSVLRASGRSKRSLRRPRLLLQSRSVLSPSVVRKSPLVRTRRTRRFSGQRVAFDGAQSVLSPGVVRKSPPVRTRRTRRFSGQRVASARARSQSNWARLDPARTAVAKAPALHPPPRRSTRRRVAPPRALTGAFQPPDGFSSLWRCGGRVVLRLVLLCRGRPERARGVRSFRIWFCRPRRRTSF